MGPPDDDWLEELRATARQSAADGADKAAAEMEAATEEELRWREKRERDFERELAETNQRWQPVSKPYSLPRPPLSQTIGAG